MDHLPGTNIKPAEIGRLALILLGIPWAFVALLMLTGIVDPPTSPFVWIAYALGSVAAWGAFLSAVTDTRTLLGRKESPAPPPVQEIHNTAVKLENVSAGRDLIIRDVYTGDQYITHAPDRPDALFHDVPPFPPHFLGRDQIVADLVAQLTTGGTVALSAEGLPGVGKTTLAVALAHHRTILDHFTDGVLWAGLGTQPDLLGTLAGWGDALGVDVTNRPTADGRAAAVRNAVGQRRLLLVIDDAWSREAAHALRLGGPHCAHLLTTRDQTIARAFGGSHNVEVLDPAPARQLLAKLAPITAQANPDGPDLVDRLLAAVGYLPLAIQLMGGYLNGENGGEPVAFATQARTVLARLADPSTRPGSVADTLNATIALSLDGAAQAAPAARATFHALGAFAPKPARFDLAAAQAVTQAEPATLARLIQRNLLEMGPDESLALHQTLAAFARTEMPDEVVIRHRGYYWGLVEQDNEDWKTIETIYEQIHWAWDRLSETNPEDMTLVKFVWKIRVYQVRRGLWLDSLNWGKVVLSALRNHQDLDAERFILVDLGLTYNGLGNKQQALECYEEALALIHRIGDKLGEATTLNNIGGVYSDIGEKGKALVHYTEALLLIRQVDNKILESSILHNLGCAYSDLGDKEKALAYFWEVLPVFRQAEDRSREAMTLNSIGVVYHALGERGKALRCYEEALPLFRQIGDKSGEATTLNNMGDIYDVFREKALTYYEEALLLHRQVGDRSGEATTLNSLGRAYDALGDKQKALGYYEEALPLSRRVGDKSGEAATLNNLGLIYHSLGHKQKSLRYYYEALTLRHQVGDKSGEAATLNNLGLAYHSLGDKQKALGYYEEALPLSRQVGDKSGEAAILNNLGGVYSSLGEKNKALKYYEDALILRRFVGDKPGEATTLYNMGSVYHSLSDKQKALGYYEEALPLQRQVGDKSGEATTLNNIGMVYDALGEKGKALAYFSEALPLRRQVGDIWGESVTRFNMGMVYADQGKLAEAEKQLKQVVAIDEAVGHPDLESDRAALARIQARRRGG